MDTYMRHTIARTSGLVGTVLVAASLVGAVTTQLRTGPARRPLPAARSTRAPGSAPPVERQAPPAVAPASDTAAVPVARARASKPLPGAHYPLQVGRYWVYRHREPGSDVVTEVERTIVRRQERDGGEDLYLFDDGGVAYFDHGRIYEMGPAGGLNVIPVDVSAPPVAYRSQGLQIEKWVGAADTTLVVGGRRWPGCIEVVTRVHRLTADGAPARTVSYSSFYAPGVGLVGRQSWPRDDRGSLAVILTDHGTRPL